ncbi:MAG: S8 family serine peptidase [Adhaeribacter sp.]
MRIVLLLLSWLLVSLPLAAQSQGSMRRHLVYFKDKANTPYSLDQPQAFLSARALQRREKQKIPLQPRDLPVNPAYVAGIKNLGVSVWYTSRWFNAAVVYCDSTRLSQVLALPFVKNGRTLSRMTMVSQASGEGNLRDAGLRNAMKTKAGAAAYGRAFNQANMIGAVDLHAAGYRGDSMYVAVFDGGFPGVDQAPAFAPLFAEKRLKGTYDFVGRDKGVFERDNHGTNVLSTMAAYEPGVFVGTAYKASYFLFITEDSQGEQQIEEINWLLAAEYADSAGVDVINSSLGYNDFDAPSLDYTYQDMNGNTALVTRAADYAAATGMLVVSSAGNDGNKAWRYIGAPADADSILTVGAVDSLGRYAGFSSLGPSADGRIKPNLSAQGVSTAVITKSGSLSRNHGTSFASPVLAGMAACFWQANPRLSNMEVIRLLQQSATQGKNPDAYLGFGIPNGWKALQEALEAEKKTLIYPNPVRSREINLRVGSGFRNDPVTVTVYNMVAQKMLSQTFPSGSGDGDLQVDVSALHPGYYGCLVSIRGNRKTLKFLKL